MNTPDLTDFLITPLRTRIARAFQIFICFVLALLACPARADLDSDGDGLTDDQEAIYRTNPLVADTDGDGVVDGLEVQMGTNPLDRNSVLKMMPILRVPGVPGGWNVTWRSVVGQTYMVQAADPNKVSSGGSMAWSTVAKVTATGPNSSYLDPVSGAVARLYRVTLAVDPTKDTLPPVVSLIQALPNPNTDSPGARLSVVARDLVGVTRVDLLDGATVLGSATRGSGDNWTFAWSFNNISLNGRHYLRARAVDAAGNAGYSPVLAFDVSLGAQQCITIGQVRICADQTTAVVNGFSFSGNIRINGINLSANSTVKSSGSLISGSGGVTVPGLGMVANGAFTVDAATGAMTVQAGASLPFAFNARATFRPTALTINLLSNSLSGAGSIALDMSGHAYGTANFNGSVSYQPLAGTVSVTGSLALQGFSASGTALLQLHDSTFSLSGDARFQSSNGDVYSISNGVARLSYALAVPKLSVSGKLGLPDGLMLTVQGDITADGEAILRGSGSGPIGSYSFNPIEGTLYRAPGPSTLVTVNFRGKLIDPSVSNFWLEGTVRSNTDIDIHGRGNVYSNGVVLSPFNLHATGNVRAQTVTVTVDGTLRANYLKPIVFNGVLRPDGSMELNAQSGPYNAAWFNGLVPPMNEPSLTFEEQVFVGCYHLLERDPGVETLFQLRYTKAPTKSGGTEVLTLAATTTRPGISGKLVLTGTITSKGEATLTGTLAGGSSTVWGYPVANISCSVNRSAAGLVTFGITGGQLSYGPFGGSATQVSGSIASDGSGFIQFDYASATLGGFLLQNASARLTQTAAGAHALTVNGLLTLKAANAGFGATTTFAASGNLNIDGSYSLTGSTSGSLALQGMPATAVSNARVTLTQSELTLHGDFSGPLFSNVGFASVSLDATVSTSGDITLRGSVSIPAFSSAFLRLSGSGKNGALTATFAPEGLSFSGATLTMNGYFSNSIPVGPFTINAQGNLHVFVNVGSPLDFNLNGYGMTEVSFWLDRTSGVFSLQSFTARLSLTGFELSLTGSISAKGGIALDGDGVFALAGFSTSGNGHLALSNTGLRATGTLRVAIGKTSLGNVSADVSVSSKGSISGDAQAMLFVSGYSVAFASLHIANSGLSGDAVVAIGSQTVPLPTVVITPAGLSSGSASFHIDSGWKWFHDPLIPVPAGDGDTGDVYGRVDGSVNVSLSAASVNLNYSVTFAWWVVTWVCDAPKCYWVDPAGHWENVYAGKIVIGQIWVDPPPYWQCDPPVCHNVYAPLNIGDVQAAQRTTLSGRIGANASISSTETHEGVSSWSWDWLF